MNLLAQFAYFFIYHTFYDVICPTFLELFYMTSMPPIPHNTMCAVPLCFSSVPLKINEGQICHNSKMLLANDMRFCKSDNGRSWCRSLMKGFEKLGSFSASSSMDVSHKWCKVVIVLWNASMVLCVKKCDPHQVPDDLEWPLKLISTIWNIWRVNILIN